jgi:hypothetical protein
MCHHDRERPVTARKDGLFLFLMSCTDRYCTPDDGKLIPKHQFLSIGASCATMPHSGEKRKLKMEDTIKSGVHSVLLKIRKSGGYMRYIEDGRIDHSAIIDIIKLVRSYGGSAVADTAYKFGLGISDHEIQVIESVIYAMER